METKNFGQFMIFKLPIYDILPVLNFESVSHEGQLSPYFLEQFLGSLRGKVKRGRIDAADDLIFNVHYLFDLNLVKKIV